MSDILQQTFYCAKTGRPFLVELAKRNGAAHYSIKHTVGCMPASANGEGHASGQKTTKLNPQDVDFSGLKCPHCYVQRSPEFVHCGKCGHDVCMGASTHDFWRCTPACGESKEIAKMGIIKSHTFARLEPVYSHARPASAFRPQKLLSHVLTPTMDSIFPLQKSSGRELVKVEQPKPLTRSIIIREVKE